MADAPDTPLINAQGVAIVVKVLTDYPRDDLASDEVHQSLIAALVRRGVVVREADVGSVPGMDTVVAGFKTAQLALNSTLGPGHVFHTNCAPRKHIVSARSQGERVVLGILDSGVALILVNSGYTLAPFKPLIEGGRAWFFESRVPDSGSQFRSRDYFPDATAAVARHLQDRLSELGPEKLSARLAAGEAATLLDGLALKAEPLPASAIAGLPEGRVWYVDNFGNLKINLTHDRLLEWHEQGRTLVVRIGDRIGQALVAGQGFSQGEGVMAITRGSSGWRDGEGVERRFAEIFLRGGSAARAFGGVRPGDAVHAVDLADLQAASAVLRAGDRAAIHDLGLAHMTEPQLIDLFVQAGLIRDGFNPTRLRRALTSDCLIDYLQRFERLKSRDDLELRA